MARSYLGYGRQPYGHPRGGSPFRRPESDPTGHPYDMNVGYGFGDWAEEVLWLILPEWVREEDGSEGLVAEPLRGFIDAIKPLFNEQLRKWREVAYLWDATRVTMDLLPALAYTVGMTLDLTKSEALQRAQVLNCTQLYVTKGTHQGYAILAGFEDLTVETIPLWSINGSLTPDAPTVFEPWFDEIPADMIPADSTYDDIHAIWPWTLHYLATEVRTNRLRLIFYPTDNPSQDFDPDVASRIATNLLRYKPLHIIIDRVTFDGLRGSSQTWVSQVDAGDSAAGMWVATVTGEQRSTSQPWVETVDATFTS